MPELADVPTEQQSVEAWRLKTALELGVPLPVAEKFAESPWADLHRLADLIERRGCPPLTAARILI
jgi:hypothetical protein